MPGEAIRLGQILKFFNMRVSVSGEGTKAFFNLRQVCERKENIAHMIPSAPASSWRG
jgi:hypothetical protein